MTLSPTARALHALHRPAPRSRPPRARGSTGHGRVQLALEEVQVGVAHPAVADPDPDLTGSRILDLDVVDDLEVTSRCFEQRSSASPSVADAAAAPPRRRPLPEPDQPGSATRSRDRVERGHRHGAGSAAKGSRRIDSTANRGSRRHSAPPGRVGRTGRGRGRATPRAAAAPGRRPGGHTRGSSDVVRDLAVCVGAGGGTAQPQHDPVATTDLRAGGVARTTSRAVRSASSRGCPSPAGCTARARSPPWIRAVVGAPDQVVELIHRRQRPDRSWRHSPRRRAGPPRTSAYTPTGTERAP